MDSPLVWTDSGIWVFNTWDYIASSWVFQFLNYTFFYSAASKENMFYSNLSKMHLNICYNAQTNDCSNCHTFDTLPPFGYQTACRYFMMSKIWINSYDKTNCPLCKKKQFSKNIYVSLWWAAISELQAHAKYCWVEYVYDRLILPNLGQWCNSAQR